MTKPCKIKKLMVYSHCQIPMSRLRRIPRTSTQTPMGICVVICLCAVWTRSTRVLCQFEDNVAQRGWLIHLPHCGYNEVPHNPYKPFIPFGIGLNFGCVLSFFKELACDLRLVSFSFFYGQFIHKSFEENVAREGGRCDRWLHLPHCGYNDVPGFLTVVNESVHPLDECVFSLVSSDGTRPYNTLIKVHVDRRSSHRFNTF